MNILTIFSIATGLAMDAFAAAFCCGLSYKKKKIFYGVVMSLFFGIFQGLMPIIGYYTAKIFSDKITDFAPYISFALLLFIGGKMILDVFLHKDENSSQEDFGKKFSIREVLLLSIATSIDSLAVGISFALTSVEIFSSSAIISLVTFMISFGGYIFGISLGKKLKFPPEIIGGAILIIIGGKILLEYLIKS